MSKTRLNVLLLLFLALLLLFSAIFLIFNCAVNVCDGLQLFPEDVRPLMIGDRQQRHNIFVTFMVRLLLECAMTIDWHYTSVDQSQYDFSLFLNMITANDKVLVTIPKTTSATMVYGK